MIYLLYRDVQQAFTTPLVAGPNGTFYVASAEVPVRSSISPCVAVSLTL